jgi:uncharacterized OsmC-like protein
MSTMKARVRLVDGMMFVGESGSGHAVVMDGAPEYGGRNLGIRPMEMLLIGLGGCTAFDVVQILRKGREQVSDCQVEVIAERAETDPKVFTKIHLEYGIPRGGQGSGAGKGGAGDPAVQGEILLGLDHARCGGRDHP